MRVRLDGVQFSFCHIFEPEENGNYSMEVLIPKDTANGKKAYESLTKAIEEAKQQGVQTCFQGKVPSDLYYPIKDGDEEFTPSGNPQLEERKGHWYINTKTKMKPDVYVGRDLDIAEPGDVRSGDYGVVMVNTAPYNFRGRSGISIYLNEILKTKNGTPFGSAGRDSIKSAMRRGEIDDELFEDETSPISDEPTWL